MSNSFRFEKDATGMGCRSTVRSAMKRASLLLFSCAALGASAMFSSIMPEESLFADYLSPIATAAAADLSTPAGKSLRPGRSYDSQGRYQGKMDSNGRMYDSQGRYQGKVESNGRVYDSQGRYEGRKEVNGRYYDSQGRYQGKMDSNGCMYDSQGRYQGRIDSSGRQYDANGRYVGQTK